ncbi:hypothetical protein F5144DRAFT_402466 [Chaetomium tenue]|uniref:Uncharacterized protein n=1 Tax=Chaetomium tenue TaxID=1854479 RepID=A0ACB7NU19_9PEZI|nr:hypothetical protein F5144DRAFT_402466 [Chaetomium globosum]
MPTKSSKDLALQARTEARILVGSRPLIGSCPPHHQHKTMGGSLVVPPPSFPHFGGLAGEALHGLPQCGTLQTVKRRPVYRHPPSLSLSASETVQAIIFLLAAAASSIAQSSFLAAGNHVIGIWARADVLLHIMAVIQIQCNIEEWDERCGSSPTTQAIPNCSTADGQTGDGATQTHHPSPRKSKAWRRHGGILHYGPVGLPPWGSTMRSSDGHTLSHGSVQSRGALRRVESRNWPTHSKSGEPSSGSSGELPALLVRRRRRRSLRIGASYLKRSALQSPTKSRPPSQASTSRLRGRCRLFT